MKRISQWGMAVVMMMSLPMNVAWAHRKADNGNHHQTAKGAALGAVAGHFAGHHAIAGAVAGGVAGHLEKRHAEKKAKRERAQHAE